MVDCLLISGFRDYSGANNIDRFIAAHVHKNLTSFFYPYIVFETVNTISYLEDQGLSCDYVLSAGAQPNRMDRILENGVRVAAILSAQIHNIHEYQEIVKAIRTKSPKTKIVIGGSFLKNLLHKLNRDEQKRMLTLLQADLYINRYECQIELSEYLHYVRDGADYPVSVCNVIYKDGKQFVYTAADQKRQWNDAAPLRWEVSAEDLGPIVGLRTTINCDFHCAFCAIKDQNEKFQLISIPKLEKDIQAVCRFDGVKTLFFTDETINYPVDRFVQFLQMMKRNAFLVNWFSFFRCQFVNEETARLAKESGCSAAIVGIESGSDRLLRGMNKEVTASQLRKGLIALQKAGIMTFALFVVGFPGEDSHSIQDTIDFINETKPTFYVLNPWTCEMGTKVWDERERYGLTYSNGCWSHHTMNSKEVEGITMQMNQQITGSKNVRGIDFSYLIQLYNDGYSLRELHKLIDAFKENEIYSE